MAQFEHNLLLQADEMEDLCSICDDNWKIIDHGNAGYAIDIGEGIYSVHLQITLPVTYPSECPPSYVFSAPWMNKAMKSNLSSEMENVYCQYSGECIIYMWIQKVKELISKYRSVSENVERFKGSPFPQSLVIDFSQNGLEKLPFIKHGKTIVDRRSVFQAHLASVVHVDQVNQVVSKLKENKKIASAKHNIVAYRLSRDVHGTFHEDSDDDGENKGGSILLHLLQISDVRDVVVVVTRWYGGIHLGSDRFKHISNSARSLLEECGYIKNKKTDCGHKNKKKKLPG